MKFELDIKTVLIAFLVVIIMLMLLFKGCGNKQLVTDTLIKHKYDSVAFENTKKTDSIEIISGSVASLKKRNDSLKSLIKSNDKKIVVSKVEIPTKNAETEKMFLAQLEKKIQSIFDTATSIKETDSIARVTKFSAKNIIKTSDSLTSFKNENELLKDNENYHISVANTQDSIINGLENKSAIQNKIIDNKNFQIDVLIGANKNFSTQQKKDKRLLTFFKITTLFALTIAAIK